MFDPANDARAASSSSAPPASDLDERTGKLGGVLLEQGLAVARGENDKCAMGRQHDVLWILQGSYLDEQGHLFEFIEDVSSYLYGLLSHFIAERVFPHAQMDECWFLFVDWINWQKNDGDAATNPLLLFMERYHRDWQNDCREFMEASCIRMGINPDEKPCSTNIPAYIESFQSLPSPLNDSAVARLVGELYRTSPATKGRAELIQARNEALEHFKREFAQMPWREVESHHQNINDLHTAESCFQAVQRYSNMLLVGSEDLRFHEMATVLSDALIRYYQTYAVNPRLPETFASLKSAFSEQEALFRAQTHSDVVENFFATMTVNRQALTSYWPRIEAIPGLQLDDAGLARLIAEHTRTTVTIRSEVTILPEDVTSETVTALSSYDINRLFLHGLYVDVRDWTNSYRCILKTVCQWLLSPVSQEDSLSLTTLKQTYPPYFLSNMLLMSLFHGEDLQLIAGCKPGREMLLFGQGLFHIASRCRLPEQQTRLLSLIAPYWNGLIALVANGYELCALLEYAPERMEDKSI